MPVYGDFHVPNLAPAENVHDWLTDISDADWREAIIEVVKRRNKDGGVFSREIGVLRRTETPRNWLRGTGFRTLVAGVPENWTATGLGGTYTQQTVRTGGDTTNKAIRIATTAALAGLKQSVEIFPGGLYGVAFWVRVLQGSGQLRIVTTGAASNLDRYLNFTTTNAPSFIAIPSRLNIFEDGWVWVPTDATGLEVHIEGDVQSTIEFCEIQFGPGPVREPDLWVPHAADDVALSSSGGIDAAYVAAWGGV